MQKRIVSVFLVVLLSITPLLGQKSNEPDEPTLTKAEEDEAYELSTRFAIRFIETLDFSPLIDEFYFSDFTQRNRDFSLRTIEESEGVTYLPGLEITKKAVREGTNEDWQRFYISANSFLFFSLVLSMSKAADKKDPDFDAILTKLIGPEIRGLLDANPNLKNFIVKKGEYIPFNSAQDLRKGAEVIEKATALLHKKHPRKELTKKRLKEFTNGLIEARKEEIFQPTLEVTDEDGYFGFPIGTRIIMINLPIGIKLIAAKDGDRLKVFTTSIVAD